MIATTCLKLYVPHNPHNPCRSAGIHAFACQTVQKSAAFQGGAARPGTAASAAREPAAGKTTTRASAMPPASMWCERPELLASIFNLKDIAASHLQKEECGFVGILRRFQGSLQLQGPAQVQVTNRKGAPCTLCICWYTMMLQRVAPCRAHFSNHDDQLISWHLLDCVPVKFMQDTSHPCLDV